MVWPVRWYMATMDKRAFGATGLEVSIIGLGGGQVGSERRSEDDAGRFLNAVLDMGINFIDTARMYGHSEERIGRHISHRRSEFVLSSKCGYEIPGYENWTGPCVTAGVERALGMMRTDHIDIMHLHSCPRDVLERGEVIEALEGTVRAGKVRIAAYSGENDALEYAIQTGRFGSIQTSVNICDQRGIDKYLPAAVERKLGVIAKRPLANAPWRYPERPAGEYVEHYWERFRAMGFHEMNHDWNDVALRFVAFTPGVSTIITGTANLGHLRKNFEAVSKGPLPDDVYGKLRDAFKAHGENWMGEV